MQSSKQEPLVGGLHFLAPDDLKITMSSGLETYYGINSKEFN